MTLLRRDFLRGTGALAALAPFAKSRAQELPKPNVLFIAVDDLNDWVSPLGGYPGVLTPNFDRLAAMGTTFANAYAHVPACVPSRAATLLGASADKTGIYMNGQDWSASPYGQTIPTLVGYLRSLGWAAHGTGKVFHGQRRPGDWDGYFVPEKSKQSYADLNNIISKVAWRWWRQRGNEKAIDFGPGDNGGRADTECADWAVNHIASTDLSAGGQFIALGLFRPHLPLVVPQAFFDLYPAEPALPPGFVPGSVDFDGNAADLADIPLRGQELAPVYWGGHLRRTDEYHEFLRAYLASISFSDHLLGKVLDAYEAVKDTTYLVLWSDHGWQLGEKLSFTKFTLWERALRVPLMIAGPGVLTQTIREPASLLDVYPTLCDLLRVPIPDHCDGESRLHALTTPGAYMPWPHAVSLWSNEASDPALFQIYSSVRTDRYRFIDYGDGQMEIYDHETDPYEWNNIAATASPGFVESFATKMRKVLPGEFAPPVPRA